MNWKQVKIYTTNQAIDILSGHLVTNGVKGVVIEDKKDFDEFLADKGKYWDYIDDDLLGLSDQKTAVLFYLPENEQGKGMLTKIVSGLEEVKATNPFIDFGSLEISFSEVNEDDWSNAWKKYYHPMKIGKKITVCPYWEQCDVNENEVKLILDPGMAFGTGSHSSTKLCMELLEDAITSEKTVLDVGCGSGILSITSLLLGAKSAVGVDIDELATKISIDNAKLNNVETKFSVHCCDLTTEIFSKFDVVCANIVADIIIKLCENITNFMNENGIFITSGIIDQRCDEVILAIENAGLKIEKVLNEKGWVAILAKKS